MLVMITHTRRNTKPINYDDLMKLDCPSDTWSALQKKYGIMLALQKDKVRYENARVFRIEGEEKRARQKVCRQLAREFPGALRELDGLDEKAIQQRLGYIKSGVAGKTNDKVTKWVRLVWDFHKLWLEAFAIRGWLRERCASDWDQREFAGWFAKHPHKFTALQELGPEQMSMYLRPARGRLSSWIWILLSRRHGLSRQEAEEAYFGGPEVFGSRLSDKVSG
jgi:hypothetical protein